jgi:serine/threonine protein kinase
MYSKGCYVKLGDAHHPLLHERRQRQTCSGFFCFPPGLLHEQRWFRTRLNCIAGFSVGRCSVLVKVKMESACSLCWSTRAIVYQGMCPTARDCKNTIGLNLILQWLRKVMEAVSYLRQHRVLHRDIKCDNGLLHANIPQFASRCSTIAELVRAVASMPMLLVARSRGGMMQ